MIPAEAKTLKNQLLPREGGLLGKKSAVVVVVVVAGDDGDGGGTIVE